MSRKEAYVQRRDSLIKKYLSGIVESGLEDFDIVDVFISEIEVNADGSFAWVYIDNDGSTEEKQEAVEILNDNRSVIRSELAALLDSRKVPRLFFKADMARESEAKIEEILANVLPVSEEELDEQLEKVEFVRK